MVNSACCIVPSEGLCSVVPQLRPVLLHRMRLSISWLKLGRYFTQRTVWLFCYWKQRICTNLLFTVIVTTIIHFVSQKFYSGIYQNGSTFPFSDAIRKRGRKSCRNISLIKHSDTYFWVSTFKISGILNSNSPPWRLSRIKAFGKRLDHIKPYFRGYV